MLSKEDLEEFQQIYEEEFEQTLSDDEAAEYANDLLQLCRAVLHRNCQKK